MTAERFDVIGVGGAFVRAGADKRVRLGLTTKGKHRLARRHRLRATLLVRSFNSQHQSRTTKRKVILRIHR